MAGIQLLWPSPAGIPPPHLNREVSMNLKWYSILPIVRQLLDRTGEEKLLQICKLLHMLSSPLCWLIISEFLMAFLHQFHLLDMARYDTLVEESKA